MKGGTFHFSLRTKLSKLEHYDLERKVPAFCLTKKKHVNNIGSTTKFALEASYRGSAALVPGTSIVQSEPEF